MSIPSTNAAELTEKMQFRVSKDLKKAVGHVMAEELANEQNTANYLLRLGVEAYERSVSEPEPRRKRA